MAQNSTASAATARKTVNVPAPAAAPLIKAAEAPMAPAGTAAAPRTGAVAPKAVAPKAVAEVPREPKAAPQTDAATAKAVAPAAAKPKATPRAGAATAKAAPRATVAAAKTTAPARGEPKAAGAVGQGLGDLVTAGRENLEACMKSGRIVAKGMETLGNEVMTLTQANIEANLAAARGIMQAKTLREVIDLQSGLAQDGIERLADESAKIGALSMRVASQAMEPLQGRLDAGARMVFRPFGL